MSNTPTTRDAIPRIKALIARMGAQVGALEQGASERAFRGLLSDAQGLVTALQALSFSRPVAVDASRPLILVVEDQEDNRLIYRRTLRRRYELVETEDGHHALEIIRTRRPKLVLMDISLPIMDGLEATRRVKDDPTIADTPIVLVTAHAMKGNREQALATGADDYLTKPFTPATLRALVQRFIPSPELAKP